MRDAEVGNIYGDGKAAIAIATHDHGVVAVLRRDDSGRFKVEELDRQPETVVHEIVIGDLNGDGVIEIYATPSAPNMMAPPPFELGWHPATSLPAVFGSTVSDPFCEIPGPLS